MAIDSPLQQAIVNYLKEQRVSQRKAGNALNVSETTYGTWARMDSAMGLDKLDKILTTYPGVKEAIIKYLRGNTDDNLTGETKNMDIEKLKLELIQKQGVINYLDEERNKLQQKVAKLESERDGLQNQVNSLKEQLSRVTAIKDGKK